ncbi:type 4 pilus major pilin [Glaciimonas sp. GG7]
MKNTFKKYKYQAGLTLMEMIAALGIMAIVVVGALALFNNANSSNTSTQALRDLISIRSSTQSLFIGQGGYGTASMNQALISSKKIPSTMTVSGSTINTVWGGTVTVTGNNTNFTIAITNMNEDICTSLLSNASVGWQSAKVGSTVLSTFPISPNIASDSAHCGTAPASIVWTTQG